MVRPRDYDPAQGRWLSKDLLPFLDGSNVYMYVLNNPINLIDPSGLAAQAPKPVLTPCPVTSGTCNIGTLDGSRMFFRLSDDTFLEQGAPVPAGKWKNGMGFAVGFALAQPFTPKGCEPLCCRGYGIIQVYCTDNLTVAPGAKPKPAGKPDCRVDNFDPDLGQKPLPEPYYGGVYFEWGIPLPMLRPPGPLYPKPIYDPSRYPTDIYDHFSSDKYRIAIFDRPNATVGAAGTWKWDEFEACLICDTGVSLKILQCITHSMDAQTNEFIAGKKKVKDVNVVQNLTSNCTNGALVKLGMKKNYPDRKVE